MQPTDGSAMTQVLVSGVVSGDPARQDPISNPRGANEDLCGAFVADLDSSGEHDHERSLSEVDLSDPERT